MFTFQVNDMTCGHCVGSITQALKAADPNVQVVVDLPRQLVMVEPADVDADALRRAIVEAGYTPIAVEASSAKPTSADKGCCSSRH